MNARRFPDWDDMYRSAPVEGMPWHYPELDPDLERALSQHAVTSGRALDLGTGAGTQACALAARGLEVTGSDLSATAVEHAARLCRWLAYSVTRWPRRPRASPGDSGVSSSTLAEIFAAHVAQAPCCVSLRVAPARASMLFGSPKPSPSRASRCWQRCAPAEHKVA